MIPYRAVKLIETEKIDNIQELGVVRNGGWGSLMSLKFQCGKMKSILKCMVI